MNQWTMRNKNKKEQLQTVSKMLNKLVEIRPSLKTVFAQIKQILLVDEEEVYKEVIMKEYEMDSWTPKRVSEFFTLYSFKKPSNYRVCSMAFNQSNSILLNLHQIEEVVQEYRNHVTGDVFEKRRDARYYQKDSGYKEYESYMQTDEDAFDFFFWHEFFQQIRILEQSMTDVDLFEFDCDMENSAKRNDMVGFAKAMFEKTLAQERMLATA